MLAQLVGSGVDAHNIGRIVTNVTDSLTRRLVQMAEDKIEDPLPFPICGLPVAPRGDRSRPASPIRTIASSLMKATARPSMETGSAPSLNMSRTALMLAASIIAPAR